MTEWLCDAHLIYKVVAGSQAYGLDSPNSDLDAIPFK
jgi:predicted nucleotidyltransferase